MKESAGIGAGQIWPVEVDAAGVRDATVARNASSSGGGEIDDG